MILQHVLGAAAFRAVALSILSDTGRIASTGIAPAPQAYETCMILLQLLAN